MIGFVDSKRNAVNAQLPVSVRILQANQVATRIDLQHIRAPAAVVGTEYQCAYTLKLTNSHIGFICEIFSCRVGQRKEIPVGSEQHPVCIAR
ncbi:hypothetical protein D3C85_1020980 [compost metagenome]